LRGYDVARLCVLRVDRAAQDLGQIERSLVRRGDRATAARRTLE